MSEETGVNLSLGAAHEAGELLYGVREVSKGPLPEPESADYMRERFALSGIMVAATTDLVVAEDKSPLGYRFSQGPPAVSIIDELNDWVQEHCHVVLDRVIATEPRVQAMARRWQHLYLTSTRRPTVHPKDIRRQNIRFDGAVYEPYAWVGIGNIAAKYVGLKIEPEQALPYASAKLGTIQQAARQDAATQDIRSAIFTAASAFGEMHTPQDANDEAYRYHVLRGYVQLLVGHTLAAETFGELYSVSEQEITGVQVVERPEGFGEIAPKRANRVDCAASLRIKPPVSPVPSGKSALFKLLRAGLNALNDTDILRQSTTIPRGETYSVDVMLTDTLKKAGKWPIQAIIVVP